MDDRHPMQRMLDAMSNASRRDRKSYHLTLEAAIKGLEMVVPETELRTEDGLGVGKVSSYRGYYSDLAFCPAVQPTTIGAVLTDLRAALGQTFEGYKGGDFLMDADTPLWISAYGSASGLAVTGLRMENGSAILTTRQTHD